MIESHDPDFVKRQAAYHRRTADRFHKDEIRCNRHLNFAAEFDALASRLEETLQFIAEAKERNNSSTQIAPPGQLRIGNLDELPEELRSQLKISESDQLEMDIVEVIRSLDSCAAIDEILVGLWRKTGKVEDRDFVARKLYRMTRANTINSVPKKKGYFTTNVDSNVKSSELIDLEEISAALKDQL
ncbi:hypothetical protein [Roseibium sediminicola]|uniref:Uncharacterized protein n=1 Tax=Roseibium sediminicola TaxID=2933272 RepID=A0ABT0GSN9_9HYPH|nr:hypothetical protein [Roseibium sp. CAU 1639]MCK7612459.1 hypothetical protein [Roseibium sp. CAU 1639]